MIVFFSILNSLILIATVAAIYFSPIKAVKIGRKLNDEQLNNLTQKNLFLTLFSYRGSPTHWQAIEALNQIDVVFHGVPSVLNSWHKYYDSLNIGEEKETESHRERWKFLRVELLSEMANHLGYGFLKQVDMMKYYYSQGQDHRDKLEMDLRESALVYLRTGSAVFGRLNDNLDVQEQEKNDTKDA